MTEVVSIRFKNRGKLYFFDPGGHQVAAGTAVIVETANGLEYAEVAVGNHQVEDEKVVQPLRAVLRTATPEDQKTVRANREKEKNAFEICREKIAAHGLDMKLVDVEYSFEGTKILFFFSSEGRVDFRNLVRDLAAVFRTRIELRQIGVRDEAKLLGGFGICGKPFCCATFLDEFQPVSIKMAKTQSLSLNPTKISGTCGRLMCCLKYEQEAYEDLLKKAPKADAYVNTPAGKGVVTSVNLLRQQVKVRLDKQGDPVIKQFSLSEIGLSQRGGVSQAAEKLPISEDVEISPPQPEPPTNRSPRYPRQTEKTGKPMQKTTPEKPAPKPNVPKGENKPNNFKKRRSKYDKKSQKDDEC